MKVYCIDCKLFITPKDRAFNMSEAICKSEGNVSEKNRDD